MPTIPCTMDCTSHVLYYGFDEACNRMHNGVRAEESHLASTVISSWSNELLLYHATHAFSSQILSFR